MNDTRLCELDDVLLEIMKCTDRGETVDHDEWIARYPRFADELREFFDSEELVASLAGPVVARTENLAGADTVVGGSPPDASDTQSPDPAPATANPSSQTPPDAGTTFGRYRLRRTLGEGAMGSVHLAEDTTLGREVALKLPKFGDDDPQMIERFLTEARTAATLRHPGICPVFDVGEIDGQHYITMAYIPGRPLSDYAKASARQPVRQVVKVIRKLCLALHAAHEAGVVHRDVKPANVMIDDRGEPVVMDFGLARQTRSTDVRLTRSGAVMGTPAYMSPEQVEGRIDDVGPRSDQFSVGAVLYEMLTGELPFPGNSIAVVMSRILSDDPRPPSELRSEVDSGLEALCLRMLSKSDEHRYESLYEVAELLTDWLRRDKERVAAAGANVTATAPLVPPPLPPIPQPAPEKSPEPAPQNAIEIVDREPTPVERSLGRPRRARRSTSAEGSRRNPKWMLPALGAGGGLLLLLGIVFLIPTSNGTLRVEVEDGANVEVLIDGEPIELTDTTWEESRKARKHRLALRIGETEIPFEAATKRFHAENGRISVTINGTTLTDDSFEVARNDRTVLRISYVPNAPGDGDWTDLTELPIASERHMVGPKGERYFAVNDIPPVDEDSRDAIRRKIDDHPAWSHWIYVHENTAELTYEFDRPVARLRGELAVLKKQGLARYTFFADDVEVKGIDVGQTPLPLDVDLEGCRELRIHVEKKQAQGGGWYLVANPEIQYGGGSGGSLGTGPLADAGNPPGPGGGRRRRGSLGGGFPPPMFDNDPDNGSLAGSGDLGGDDSAESTTRRGPSYALWFDGEDDRVELDLPDWSGDAHTVEAFVRVVDGPGIVFRHQDRSKRTIALNFFGPDEMFPNRKWAVRGGAYDGDGTGWTLFHEETTRVLPPVVHVALCVERGRIRLYVDGQPIEGRPGRETDHEFWPPQPATIGGFAEVPDGLEKLHLHGGIDELRVSTVARYDDSFTPPEHLDRASGTLALYRFDTGRGPEVWDDSGNGHNGRIIGAKWIAGASLAGFDDSPTNSPPRVASDTDREIAERIIALGGRVRWKGAKGEKVRYVDHTDHLPAGPFRVDGVSLYGNDVRFRDEHVPLLFELPELEALYFGPVDMTDAGFARLADLDTVDYLSFVRSPLGNEGLAALVRMKKLAELELYHTDVTNEGLAALGKMPGLRRLTIGHGRKAKYGPHFITDAGLAHLPAIENLERLWIHGGVFTDGIAEHVAKCRDLWHLMLATSNVSDEAVDRMHSSLKVGGRLFDKRGESDDRDDDDPDSMDTSAIDPADVLHHFPFDGETTDVAGRARVRSFGRIAANGTPAGGRASLHGPSGSEGDRLELDIAGALARTEFSVSLWARFDEVMDHQAPRLIEALTRDDEGRSTGVFGLVLSRDAPKYYTTTQDGAIIGPKVIRGRWQHYVMTRTEEEARLYVDGRLVGTAKTTDAPEKPDVVMLGGIDWAPRDWDGLLDELTIFDHALDESEITGLQRQPGLVTDLLNE